MSFVAVFAVAMILGQPAFANGGEKIKDKKDAAPDFDIRKAGIDKNGNPFIKVTGTAGGTSAPGVIFAYLIVTDDGTYVAPSHDFDDDPEQGGDGGLEYHGHKVTSTDSDGCVTGLSTDSEVVLSGKKITFTGTSATEVLAAVTAVLWIETDPSFRICAVPLDTT